MLEKVSTEDGVPDICDEENLVENLTESKVKSAGCHTKGRDAGVIGRLEWGTCTEGGVWQLGSWQNADLSSHVHEVWQKNRQLWGRPVALMVGQGTIRCRPKVFQKLVHSVEQLGGYAIPQLLSEKML